MANVGSIDRIIRLVAGVLLVALPYLVQTTLFDNPIIRWGVPIVGVVLIVTAVFRICPLYRLIGVSTCKAS